MKTILVPTDFSATSRNAFEYAKQLAKKLDAKIKIVHVHDPYGDLALALFKGDSAEFAMKEFTADSDNFYYETEILRGDAVRQIVKLTKQESEELIVMGSTGLQDFLSKIIGTVSLDVMNKAHAPVIIVPRDTVYKPIERILFATSSESVEPKILREALAFAQVFKAEIHFVNISNTKKDEKEGVLKKVLSELIDNVEVKKPFEMVSISGNNVVEQLKQYAGENEIDLLMFVNRHRNFFQAIIHKSITQQIVLSYEKPMMVMHHDDN
jgi:nucleotide-binding universal stress UspA family protein